MLINFFRAIVLYIIVLIVMRLMGKREIGELQPFELAISIMIADLASIPMTEIGIPISNGIIPILRIFVYVFYVFIIILAVSYNVVIKPVLPYVLTVFFVAKTLERRYKPRYNRIGFFVIFGN